MTMLPQLRAQLVCRSPSFWRLRAPRICTGARGSSASHPNFRRRFDHQKPHHGVSKIAIIL